jgi:hypothetical protein
MSNVTAVMMAYLITEPKRRGHPKGFSAVVYYEM